ncbi:hypothetical protein SteCoe_8914 [Stentor coeruleus]|uniref:Vacuolar protein sorting-associated protein 8 central domain-containing protein n=1 Tax=Stentor coeruleus TaxID=5963 RepID=A0A1R2CIZ6_9CILI|nr:hypothetical protein SteCoe_8914 [Stentor coeruleus]
MADPIELLHKAKLEKFNKKVELKNTSPLSSEELAKALPFLEHRFINIDTSALTSLCASGERIIYGTTDGTLHSFTYEDNQTHSYKPVKKNTSPVISLDIYTNRSLISNINNQEPSHLIVGHASGYISFYEIKTSKLLHTITSYKSPILCIKFCKSVEQIAVLSDKLQLISLEKKLLKFSVKQLPLPDLDENIVTFDVLVDKNVGESYMTVLSFDRLVIFPIGSSRISFEISSLNPKATPYMACKPGDGKYIIAVSYGNIVVVYNVLREGFNASLCFNTPQDVCGLKWVKKNTLVTLSRYSDISVYLFDGKKKEVVQEMRINLEMMDQKYLIDTIGLPCSSFHNSVSGHENIIALGKGRVCVFSLFSWDKCLDALVSKDKFLEALNLGAIFLKEKGFAFMEVVPNKGEILNKLQQIISKYIQDQKTKWADRIAISIEYSAKYNLYDLIFETIFPQINQQKNFSELLIHFTQEISPYIQNGLIRNIPSDPLSKYLDYLISSNDYELIESIILHIEPLKLDSKLLTPICDKYDLINAFIYINTQSTLQSFVNPLKKIFKLISKSKDEGKKKYFAYNLLWYIKMCFNGLVFPKDEIPEENRKNIVVKITTWIIKRKHMEVLLDIDSIKSFEIFSMVFYNKDVFWYIKTEQALVLGIVNKLESLITGNCVYFNSAVEYLIRIYQFTGAKLKKSSVIAMVKYYNEKARNDSEEKISEVVISLLRKNRPFETSEINELFKIVRSSRHIEILSFLYRIREDYNEAVLCYLQADDENVKKMVFIVIHEILEEIDPENTEGVKETVMRNLGALAEIDTEMLGKLINYWFKGEHSVLIEKLSAAPKLQMKYLTDLMKTAHHIDEKLVLMYIKLLCEYETERLLPFLESSEDFSYDECLKIVSQYNNIEAIAYMHEKLGSFQEAISILIDQVKNLKYSIMKKHNKGEEITIDTIKMIRKYLDMARDVCERRPLLSEDDESEEVWYYLLNSVLELHIEMQHLYEIYPVLLETLDICLKNILEPIVNHVDFDTLISKICSNHGTMPFKNFREGVIIALSRFSYTEKIIQRVNSLVLRDKSELTNKLMENYMHGMCSDDFYCAKCKKDIHIHEMLHYEDRILVFECGHMFHVYCSQIKSCSECREIEVRNREFVNSLRNKKFKRTQSFKPN